MGASYIPVVHKIISVSTFIDEEHFVYGYYCGARYTGKSATDPWRNVTCKHCLNKRDKDEAKRVYDMQKTEAFGQGPLSSE